MKDLSKLGMVLVLVIIVFSACLRADTIKSTSPEKNIIVKGDEIYLDNELYAKLSHYYQESVPDKRKLIERGLLIHYFKTDKNVWIYPKRELDMSRGHYFTTSKSEAVFSWIYDIKISSDGRFVCYVEKRPFIDSKRKYAIEW